MKIAESLQKGIRFLLGLALNERYTTTRLSLVPPTVPKVGGRSRGH